ncbi:MAG: hypothetical protein EXR75_07780 [Myxococcales bacterium]|nr:hypothetical protein [Myxococcales bacterium]
MTRYRPLALLLSLAFGCVGLGCTDPVGECNALIDIINQRQSHIHDITRGRGAAAPTPESLESLATALDNLSAKIRALPVKNSDVGAFRSHYATMVEALADAVRKLALNVDDQALIDKANAELAKYRQRERVLRLALNRFCTKGDDSGVPTNEPIPEPVLPSAPTNGDVSHGRRPSP